MTSLPDSLTALPLSRAAAARVGADPGADPRTVAWDFPELPAEAKASAEDAWGVRVVQDPAASRPQRFPAFGTLFAHARVEQVLRALAAGTNLVLPGARVRVIGDGTLAETAAHALARGGSRVVRVTSDATSTLRARLAGHATARLDALGDPLGSDLAVVTGEGHPPIVPPQGVAIDASPDATGLRHDGEGGRDTRAGVRSHRSGWVVAAPAVFTGTATARERHVIDLLVALSLLAAHTEAPDAVLAELAVAS